MKDYTEYSARDIIHYGIEPFLAMSIIYFEMLSQEFEPIHEVHISDELRLSIQQYCDVALNSIGQSTPNHNVSSEHYDPETLLEAWKILFSVLEKAGYKEAVQNWLEHFTKVRVYFASRLNKSLWEDIFLNWNKVETIQNGPDLSLLQTQQITIIFLQQRVDSLKWCCRMQYWFKEVSDTWSKYVLGPQGTTSWIGNALNEYYKLKMWAELFTYLDRGAVITLDRWGQSVFERIDADRYFNLLELAHDLEIHGYLTHSE